MELTEQHKSIYNLYLKHLALKNKRPYKKRLDFSNLPEDRKVALIKLGMFFDRNPEINIDLYFKVGFMPETSTFLKLENFYSIDNIKRYNRFIKRYYNLAIESQEVIDDFVNGLKFIINFLKDTGIKLKDYPIATNKHGIKFILMHLKKQQISLYHFHCFGVSFSEIDFGDEILNMYLEDFRQKFFETKRQYDESKTIKTIGNKIKLKIERQ